MNGVVTQKELKALLKDREKVQVESVTKIVPDIQPEPDLPASTEEHFLFHPDNPSNRSGYKSGVHLVKIEGIEKKVPISDGVLKTDSVEVKNELIKQGFVFMYTKPKE